MTGNALQKLRMLNGLTQKQLADASGVPQGTISRIEADGEESIKKTSVVERLMRVLVFEESARNSEPGVKGEDWNTTLVNEEPIAYNATRGIPMYNSPGSASGVEIYTDRDSTKVIGYLNFPGITKGSFALPIYGSSMNPTLESGSWAVCRPIENKFSINWGQVYYIEYHDYRVFKRLLAADSDDEVVLWSDNQHELINGRPKHAPVTIKKSEIRTLSLVTDIYKKSNH